MTGSFDLIVVGGGRAANLALAACKSGLKTALVERHKLGGTCPNRGCVPSKLLIGFAEAARHVREVDRHFIDAQIRKIDAAAAFRSVNEYVGEVDGRYEGRLQQAGVDLIRGEAAFVGYKKLAIGNREIESNRIVIATGSHPTPALFSELPVWTSDALFPLNEAPPKSLLVIGGGFIGCEMSAFFAGAGVETHLFARGGRLLGREDGEIEKVFQSEFEKEVHTHCHASLVDLQWDGSVFTATFDVHGEREVFKAERVLFAIGRRPNTAELQLENTGLETNGKGFIPVDEHLQTVVEGIFAAGDVNGRYMLQHATSFEVNYLRRKFLKGNSDPIDDRLIAHAVFTHPEVASVGLTEEELKESGTSYVSVFEDWLASARAMAMRIEYPRIKLLVSPKDYSILGCHLVGPESCTLLHQVLAVMHLKNDVRELADMIYIHPGLNECILAAAVKAIGKVSESG